MICLPTPDNDNYVNELPDMGSSFYFSCSVGFCKMLAVLIAMN